MNNHSNPHIDQDLLIRFLSGDASDHEKEQVQQWIQASEQNQLHFEQLSLLWTKSAALKDAYIIDTKADWQQVKARINFTKAGKEEKLVPKERSLVTLFIRIAAIFILTIGLGWLAYNFTQRIISSEQIVAASNIEPSQITLPDGTKVFLNKNATLTYPKSFDRNTREVAMTGEAYFEVVTDPQKPFLITTGNTTTQVLGTSFNVYKNGQNVVVNVVTGKVAMYETASQDKKITMIAGEQGNYQDRQLSKSSYQNSNFLSWKTGILTFKDTPLPEVIHDLNKHYQQHLILETEELANCTLTSTFAHQTFADVLEELQLVLPVTVAREGKDIIISGEGCSSSR